MEKQGLGGNVEITNAVGASNVCTLTFAVKDNDGKAVEEVVAFDIWLADAVTGLGLTGSVSGVTELAALSGFGEVIGVLTAKKAARVITNALGVFKISYTDTGKVAVFPCATVPNNPGRISVGAGLVTASFG